MSACKDMELLLQGFVDGELDAANSVRVEAHLKGCSACTEELSRIETLRALMPGAALRHAAPDALRARIEAQIGGASVRANPPARIGIGTRGRWASGGAFAGIAATLLAVLAMPQLSAPGIEDELVSSHVRSLLANHLTDVATSNRHVVKPWFNGRIDFAPPVIELADQGFPLVGGRLDYIGDRVVAALVYRRKLHSINLFVRPAASLVLPMAATTHHDGYSIVHWTHDGLEFWAVSDVDTADLENFHMLFAARAGR